MNDEQIEVKSLRLKDWVEFRCQLCGQCCRHIKESVMVESLDAYRIAKYLRNQGQAVQSLSDIYARYTEPVPIAEDYPIFLLNTTGPDDACVFLEDGRCSIYPARPRVCRMYPFSVGPGTRGRDFEWLQCMEKPFHFTGGKVLVKDWFYQNLTREDREYVKREFDSSLELGKLVRKLDDHVREQALIAILFLRYDNFDLDEPFLPQYDRNLQTLKARLSALAESRP